MKAQHNSPQRLISLFALLALALCALPALAEAPEGVVNINTANAEELTLLPRIGPALAQRILEFREENGEFERPEDLILVRGIGEKTFALMEPYVATSGETTLTTKVRQSQLAAADRD